MTPIRLAVMLASLSFALPAMAQDKLTLILDWYVNPDHAPIILAQEKGFFAQQGLEVEIVAPADPAEPPKLVAAGKADLAVSYQPQLHLQVHEGLPVIRVGTLVATPSAPRAPAGPVRDRPAGAPTRPRDARRSARPTCRSAIPAWPRSAPGRSRRHGGDHRAASPGRR